MTIVYRNKNVSMRNIKRIENKSNVKDCWFVQMQRNKLQTQRAFFDYEYGSKAKALKEAKKFRDALLDDFQKAYEENLQRKSKRGIYKKQNPTGEKSGKRNPKRKTKS